jgi:hypothetical protein
MDLVIDGYSFHITLYSNISNLETLEDENIVLLDPRFVYYINIDNKFISDTISNK